MAAHLRREAPCQPPSGLWAIGNELASVAALRRWAEGVSGAACLSLRRLPKPDRIALACVRAAVAIGPAVALHARADLALLQPSVGLIGGVHALPLQRLRQLLPAPRWLMASTHDADERAQALQAGADGLLFGPIWETPAKAGILAARGVDALHQAVATSGGRPIIAIGGITCGEQVAACRAAGAHGVALLRAAREPQQWQELLAAWSEAR